MHNFNGLWFASFENSFNQRALRLLFLTPRCFPAGKPDPFRLRRIAPITHLIHTLNWKFFPPTLRMSGIQKKWKLWGSNPGLTAYEAVALTTELSFQKSSGTFEVPLISPVWLEDRR